MSVSDHRATPYGIQWMKFDADCGFPDLEEAGAPIEFLQIEKQNGANRSPTPWADADRASV
jgi:hypothetical protein